MQGEIIAIGNELTSGRIFNTTSGFAARHLFAAGYDISAMHTIGDSPALIGEVLKRAVNRVDFILVTGGLGSTDDDLTTEAVSKALGRPTMPNLDILSQIRNHLDATSAPPMSPLEKLAWLPEGAEALTLESNMAGYQLTHDNKPIFFLPGVPDQMQTLLLEQVLPRLAAWNQGRQLATRQRIYKVIGIDEDEINRRITKLALDPEIDIGYYPVYPEVHLSLIVRTPFDTDPDPLFKEAGQAIVKSLGQALYGTDQESLASVTGQLLSAANLQLATAESCTGGLIGRLLTSVAGSSSYFLGGVIAYANSMKTGYLNVSEQLLARHGAVSREVAAAMAIGIRDRSKADIGIAVTGIAGPDGGTMEKPVGTVYIGLATKNNVETRLFHFVGSRQQIQEITAKTALDLVRHYLLQQSGS